jgi:hypothetical protein
VDAAQRQEIIDKLGAAFSGAEDVTPADGQPLHVLLTAVELSEPWKPSETRALTIWRNWPSERPEFYIDYAVLDDQEQPPRSSSETYLLGETWRAFSFQFPWNGDDPVLVVQRWLTRFDTERPQ